MASGGHHRKGGSFLRGSLRQVTVQVPTAGLLKAGLLRSPMAAMLQLMYGGYAHVSDSEIESESEINEPLN
eukprot:955551-Pyramimonas_sp.AAC.1